METEMNVRGCD